MISSPLKVVSKSQTVNAIRLAMRCSSWQVVGRGPLPLFEDNVINMLCLVKLDMQYVHVTKYKNIIKST